MSTIDGPPPFCSIILAESKNEFQQMELQLQCKLMLPPMIKTKKKKKTSTICIITNK